MVINMPEAINLIRSLDIGDAPVVLACSYGPDSMVLLHLLVSLNLNVIVAHVNHKLRPEADEEYRLLAEYCQAYQIIFVGRQIDEYPKGNVENNARDIRYAFFKDVLQKYQAQYLFTAHHGDDLIETIMMRLVRGTSFKGYRGFNKITEYADYTVVRPLIYYTKDEIIEYAQANQIIYAIDQTNYEDKYTRNRMRHHILPILKNENKNVHQKFLKFSEIINEYEEYFNKETNSLYQQLFINNRLDINEFMLLDKLLQKRLLHLILFNIYEVEINKINDRHLAMIMNLIDKDESSYIVLPNNLKIAKFYNMITFDYHVNQQNNYSYVLKNEVSTPFGKIIKVNSTDIEKSNDILRLNSQEINLPIYVRTRKIGDKIAVKNLAGTSKISDILIDEKVPKNERDIYPVVVDNNEQVLWLPGIKKSKNDKLKSENYDIILKYVQEGEKDEKQE